MSAFTPALRGGLETKGGTMNVQVAARMDRNGERLILTLGTPIITIEY
ncbi:MAG: YwmB family TATA-box binding protein [Planifilum fimeticola]